MTYTGREAAYTWSKPYVNNSIVIAVLAESDIQTPADLAGKVVIVQSDSSGSSEKRQLQHMLHGYEVRSSRRGCG